MAEDIFMDYVASSSPIDLEQGEGEGQGEVSRIQLNIPRIGTSFDEILSERNKLSSNLRKFVGNTQETRLKILQLRRFNRHLSNVIIEQKRRLNELKDLVDNLNSKLLCKKFEKHHLLDEIKNCLNSKNIFETIELEPFDSFQEISDSHELMIKRLQMELSRRQELQNELNSILIKKQKTEIELENKKKKIEDLRFNLQNLIKSSKPLIDIIGYDLEEFHKKKMIFDEINLKGAEVIEGGVKNYEELKIIYEKLISFVSDKPNFKLRYFDLNDDEDEDEKDKEEDDKEEDDKEEDDKEDGDKEDGDGYEDKEHQQQHQHQQHHHQQHQQHHHQQHQQHHHHHQKSSYIQIKMEIEEVEPLEIFLKISENSSKLILSIKHEILIENSISTWLNFDKEVFEVSSNNENSITSWLLPKKLQFDQNSENFNEIFSILKDSIKIRNQLQNLIHENFEILEFDKNNPNEIVLLLPLERNLKAKVSMNSINWINASNESETINENDLIINLNLIGSKYRSIIDCLQAQISIIKQLKQ